MENPIVSKEIDNNDTEEGISVINIFQDDNDADNDENRVQNEEE